MPKYRQFRIAPGPGGGSGKKQARVIERPEGPPPPHCVPVVDETPTSGWADYTESEE